MRNMLITLVRDGNKNMRFKYRLIALLSPIIFCSIPLAWGDTSLATSADLWDKQKAAQWLDARAEWWLDFPLAQQPTDSHGTVSCFACHTAHTYTLVRPLLAQGSGWNDRIFPRSKSYSTAMALLALMAPRLDRVPKWRR